jgi:hypothetical protein
MDAPPCPSSFPLASATSGVVGLNALGDNPEASLKGPTKSEISLGAPGKAGNAAGSRAEGSVTEGGRGGEE